MLIERRFRGPPTSGNGGYVAGMLARELAGPNIEVRLNAPPPLDVTLQLTKIDGKDGSQLELRDSAATLIATARNVPLLALTVPDPPGFADAIAAASRFANFDNHAFPGCFVCGPARAEDDGLRIFAGSLSATRSLDQGVAAPWTPAESLGHDGVVESQFIWAALDCPGAFAVCSDGRRMLLGQLTATIIEKPRVGANCVVTGWHIASIGRKHQVGTALHAIDGRLLACAQALWIEPRA